MVERKLWSRVLLWHETTRSRPHLLVIVRDPSGHQPDDFFITSDTSMTPAEVAGLYSAVWHWYLVAHAENPTWPDRPWYTSKRTPSFADALAALRGATRSAILGAPARDLDSPQIATTLISVLANAA
jgi:hypothetical protein